MPSYILFITSIFALVVFAAGYAILNQTQSPKPTETHSTKWEHLLIRLQYHPHFLINFTLKTGLITSFIMLLITLNGVLNHVIFNQLNLSEIWALGKIGVLILFPLMVIYAIPFQRITHYKNLIFPALLIPLLLLFIIVLPVCLVLLVFFRIVGLLGWGSKYPGLQHILANTNHTFDLNQLITIPVSPHSPVQSDKRIIQNVLDFGAVKIRECVVPRPEIEAIAIDDSIENLRQKFIDTGFSKILVYQHNIDNIVGFAPSITLFNNPANIASMIIKLPVVPENMPANKLLEQFIRDKKSIALVVDEFGGTAGIVTLEDIIEEIIGDIQDEHDLITLEEKQFTDTEFRFSGRLEIDYLNEKFRLGLPESDDYETIAGYILNYLGYIPNVNDTITIAPYTFKILKATKTKVELIHLKINQTSVS